ncbi:hypothetical protein ACFL1S_02805 [Pseudomonadota bacterium]
MGISKNRVLETYTDFDYYFFIEDDVYLINEDVFRIHIRVSEETNLHHLSLFSKDRLLGIKTEIQSTEGTVIGAQYGSAQFNYFTKYGIIQTGGFHPMFSKYKRFGHTEHSYRYVNCGLADYPFYTIEKCFFSYMRFYDPVSVSRLRPKTGPNRLFSVETSLIDKRLKHFPITTISKYIHPNSLSLEEIRAPRFWLIYLLLFSAKMSMLNLARKLKKYVEAN